MAGFLGCDVRLLAGLDGGGGHRDGGSWVRREWGCSSWMFALVVAGVPGLLLNLPGILFFWPQQPLPLPVCLISNARHGPAKAEMKAAGFLSLDKT